jgi:hypothetical protein
MGYLYGFICAVVGLVVGTCYGVIGSKSTIKKLRKSNSSLIADLSTGLTITTSQRDEYNRIVQEHKVLNEEQNNIIVYLRDSVPTMLDGRYNSFSTLVIAILKGK